jgi:predicted HTH domain antitoxin
MEEVEHIVSVLKDTKKALKEKNSFELHELSNKTIHSASLIQDPGSITLAVIVYSLGKLIERGDDKRIKRWGGFEKKVDSLTDLAVIALNEGKYEVYVSYLEKIRKTITSISANLKRYIQEVLRKASINKASKIYEHGISLGQTAKLLGVSEWELSEYAGQKHIDTREYENPEKIKKRAAMALEFFSEGKK